MYGIKLDLQTDEKAIELLQSIVSNQMGKEVIKLLYKIYREDLKLPIKESYQISLNRVLEN